jgi:AcrR family transcriptional regulator
VLERASLFADDNVIGVGQLPAPDGGIAPPAVAATAGDRRKPLSDAELARLSAGFSGTRRELAAAAGLSERSLYRRLRDIGAG